MLIDAITFEIRDFTNGDIEEFVVENTEENQEKVFSHRYTRQIEFTRFLDFDFAKKEHVPSSFLEIPDGIDPVDEMVGTF